MQVTVVGRHPRLWGGGLVQAGAQTREKGRGGHRRTARRTRREPTHHREKVQVTADAENGQAYEMGRIYEAESRSTVTPTSQDHPAALR